jgi:hypothetical protein
MFRILTLPDCKPDRYMTQISAMLGTQPPQSLPHGFLPFREEFGPLQRDLAVVHSLSLVEAFPRRSPEVSGSSVMLRFHGNHPGYNSSFPDHVLGLGEQSLYFRVLTARAAQLDT